MRRGAAAILRMAVVPLLLLSQLLQAPGAAGVWFNLPAMGTKCVSEEIQPNVVALADYAVIHEGHTDNTPPTIAAKVTSPYGNTLHHEQNVTVGQFAFTTSEAGNYLACFWRDSGDKGGETSISLDWKIGIQAKDWDSVAKKEKIEGVELELTKLEAAVRAIHENLLNLKSREAGMREVSEMTNARVAWFSLMSLGICIVVSILQLRHLTGYFEKKKLI